MSVQIASVIPGSPAAKARLRAGDTLVAINGHPIEDVLDYRFYIPDTRLKLTVVSDGRSRTVRLRKEEYQEIGLEFDTYLMDEQRSCRNKCIFCFIDQLPSGMRESLYFKDDDSRLSFLFGNYITLTNLTEHEIDRIIAMHISPINISVHTTNPDLRCRMMNNRFAGDCLQTLHRFVQAGLTVQCQLVLVPGYNDGEELDRTLRDLAALGPAVRSVAAVPVGLTRHREGLLPLRPFTPEECRQVIHQLETAGDAMLASTGSRVFYPSDEWYIRAGLPVPDGDYYEEYAQLENGVGMTALLREQFVEALEQETRAPRHDRFVIATGVAAAPFLQELVEKAKARWPYLQVQVVAVRNDFFGELITVSGLVTGGDLIKQCEGIAMDTLLLPENMLRQEQDRFLDDVTPSQVEEALHTKVCLVPETDGAALLEAFM
ncbi:MAG: DUF512 domain-containing protein [Ruminococcaceae bacterium]|nr:DUF512 domain-containing protein [Oscillospiraceae bacterium]